MKDFLLMVKNCSGKTRPLIEALTLAALNKRDRVYRQDLTATEKEFLKINRIPFGYNQRLFEWEIKI